MATASQSKGISIDIGSRGMQLVGGEWMTNSSHAESELTANQWGMILEPDPLHLSCTGQTSGRRHRLVVKLHISVRSTFGRESAVHHDVFFVILFFARDIGRVDVRAFNKGLVAVWIISFGILLHVGERRNAKPRIQVAA